MSGITDLDCVTRFRLGDSNSRASPHNLQHNLKMHTPTPLWEDGSPRAMGPFPWK